MAPSRKWKRTVDITLPVIYFIITIQLTSGLALPRLNVPSFALPENKETESKNHGPLSELVSDVDIHRLFQIAEDGVLKIKDSVNDLANSDAAVKIKNTIDGVPWEELIHLHGEDSNAQLQFGESSYLGTVYENNDINEKVDGLDELYAASMQPVSYQLSGQGSENFRIEVDEDGRVSVFTAAVLDREQTPSYHLQLLASTQEPRETTTDLIIVVLDKNDNVPVFAADNFVSSTYTGAPVGTQVVTVHASDADEGSNRQITYSMEPDSPYFKLDPNTGVITVSKPPATGDYSFLVEAEDHGDPPLASLSADVTIIVKPLSPQFHPYGDDIMYPPESNVIMSRVRRAVLPGETFDLSENAAVNSVVYTVPVMGSDLRYAMGSPANGNFAVDEMSGDVTLLQSLDYETTTQLILNVEITNSSDPAVLDTLQITFNIQDADDPPVWTMPVFPYIGVVPLDVPNRACIYTLTASDPDEGSVITYFLRTGGNGQFSVGETDGCIYTVVNENTNYVDQEEYILSVYAVGTKDTFMGEVSGVVSIFGGSHPPQFSEEVYIASVDEDSNSNQQVVTQVQAFSFSNNVEVEYSLVGPANRPEHTINPSTGVITLTDPMPLLRSETPSYFLIVQAMETGGSSLSSTARVNVMVNDISNCDPTFGQEYFTFMVAEAVTIGETVATVTASDCDTGVNADLTYSITTNQNDFKIDSSNGDISPLVQLDYEEGPRYFTFQVQAVDGGSPSRTGTAMVLISLDDVNEAPVFNPDVYQFSMDETAAVGYEVGTVYVSDQDGNDVITLAIIDGDSTYSIDSSTGVITLQQAAADASYQFNISATDSAGLTTMASVTILVTDVNDNIPVFPDCQTYAPTISEGASVNSEVITVTATDEDRGSNAEIAYDIFSPDVAIKLFFSIDENGVIRTVNTLNREEYSSFDVTVSARDQGQPALTGLCTFTVNVTDINDNLPFFPFSEYRETVLSTTPLNEVILQVRADDIDEIGTISYSAQGSGTNYFGVQPGTEGFIFVRADLSSLVNSGQTVQQETFTVTADDGTNPPTSVPVIIDIRDPTDQGTVPQFEQNVYQVRILENTTVGTLIQDVMASDTLGYNIAAGLRPETNSELTFNLITPNGEDGARVRVQQPLDFERVERYTLTLRATSASDYQGLAEARVIIEDINDESPIFPVSTYYANVAENQPTTTPVITIIATDRDATEAFRNIQYTILTDQTEFAIDSTSGEITTLTEFDRESLSNNRIAIQVQASDGANANTVTVIITIVDENDNEPEFNGTFRFEIAEDTAVGTEVGVVTANDADISQSLEYFISSGNDRGAFAVDDISGRIFVAGILDFETTTSYSLGYSVNDGINVATTTVTVDITNVNDVAPSFGQTQYTANVLENESGGLPRTIVTVSATDEDVGASDDDIVYSLQGPEAGTTFTIDPQTGAINLTRPLDRENVAEWLLVATATDDNGNGLSSYATVRVIVDNVNDNAPSFPDQEYVGSVREGLPMGTPVVTVTAEDPDDEPLTYSIVGGDSSNFDIDSGTGQVTTTSVLDREIQDTYTIVIQATDGVQDPAETEVVISVLDVNDNQPVFIGTPYPAVQVSESEPVGFIVTTVSATDPDVDFRDTVQFRIESGNTNGLFDIITDTATLTGLIQIKSPLDFESTQFVKTYTLRLEVLDRDPSDGSMIPMGGATDVTIQITDANDNVPVFGPTTYSGMVSEAAPVGTPVGTPPIVVSATDDDEGTTLSFMVDPATDPESQFAVSPAGALTVGAPLDRETVATYNLRVWAIDNGDPALTGTATVTVNIKDVNDTPPRFAEDYTPSVKEGPQQVTVIQTVVAVDDDEPASGPPFVYDTVDGNWNQFFTVAGLGQSTSSGVIVSTRDASIDRETYPAFEIVFTIAETVPDPLTGTSTLTIMVEDDNDNPHTAVTKNILVYSYEAALPEVNLGNIPTSPIGMVGVTDPDILMDKTYTIPPDEPFPSYFTLDGNTGQITIQEGTPAGVYTMRVIVSDGGVFEDVISTVVVEVRDIPQEAVFSSGSIRFSGATAEELITPNADGVSKLDSLKTILANAVGAQEENLDIFSVLNVPGMERTVDIRYAAHGSPYYPADRLDLAALGVQDEIEGLGLTIAQLPVDLCREENVCESSCTNVLVVDPTPTVVDSGSASFVAVTSYVQPQCVCGARLVAPGACTSNPCLNGGTCTDVHGGGFSCQCPTGFDGPNCQQTKRSFSDGYATFSTLRQCEETRLTLEFITESTVGTLLYNGPIGPLSGDDPIDLILLELVNGNPRLTINLGSTEGSTQNLVLEVPNGADLSDGEWHRVDIYRNGGFVEMTIDRCADAVVTESSSSTSGNFDSCRISGTTPGPNKFLNVNTPLFLGGIDSSKYTPPRVTVPGGFDGCIRNLDSDGFLYDLGTSGQFENSEPGCPRTDGQCTENGLPVCNNGTCDANLNSFVCICFPGYTGDVCNIELEPYDFAADSYVTYMLMDSTNYADGRTSNYQVMVRTRELEGLVWSISNTNTYEFIRMQLVDGYLRADWHLGDAPITVTMDGFLVSNGAWHAINFDRYDNVVTIKIDGGGGVKQVENRESTFNQLAVDPESLIIGAIVTRGAVSQDFTGCMNDPRVNNFYLGFDGSNDYATATKSVGVTEGCVSDVCLSSPCTGDRTCMDHWRFWECVCPVGTEPLGLDQCLNIIDCDPNPCENGGTCSELDPTGFQCRCPPGYGGETCQISVGASTGLGITPVAIVLLIICILLIVLLLLGLMLYSRSRERKSALAFAVDPEDDIRENFINYDEEGGGEEDNDAYDLNTLRKPVDSISAGSIEKKPIVPVEEIPRARAPGPLGDDPNVGDFINDRLKGANDDPNGPPYDTLHTYDFEGEGSTAGSLSSLNSSSTESEQNYDYLNDWGPQFRKLADMYGGN